MRLSQNFTRTLKNAPADEVSRNAQLLIRAGFVYKTMAGVYSYTPLGLRVLKNIKQIVREEMNAIGSQELIMSSLQNKDIWLETGRWSEDQVDVWFKSKLQDGTEVGFGWTHEEPIIDMVRSYLKSYKDLPISVYQFQNKLRNELRVKSGIMRGREFIMKDMYSMHTTKDDLEVYYQRAIEAYTRCYERFGLGEDTFVTFASGGAFTKFSHEFQTICDAGEDDIFVVPSKKIAFNAEIAPVKSRVPENIDTEQKPLEFLDDTSVTGVEALIDRIGISITSSTKAMFYETSVGVILAVVRSDYQINEDKLKSVVNATWVKLASENAIRDLTGAEPGFAGLYGLPENVTVVVDESCEALVNFETGANETGRHAYNVNWGRDVSRPDEYVDIKVAKPGDVYPETGEAYDVRRTAEVGNIFNFGTQKSEEMNLVFTGDDGKEHYAYVGSYGIGVTRVMGVIVEKFSDEKGIVWPENIAPAKVYLVQIGKNSVATADELYAAFEAQGITVIYDDRAERPGEKFADAELMGIPYRVTVSDRLMDEQKCEFTSRATGETVLLTREELLAKLS